jgi:hypothetical protein
MSVSVHLVRLKSAPKSTEIFYGESLLDQALQPMTFNTMSLPE